MSYCRWSFDSHVYVYYSVDDEYCCCGCSLQLDSLSDFTCKTAQEMIDHLYEHVKVGDLVPKYALEGLQYDIDNNVNLS